MPLTNGGGGESHKDLTPDLRDVCGPYFDPSTVQEGKGNWKKKLGYAKLQKKSIFGSGCVEKQR